MSGWGAIYNNTNLALQTHMRELARLQEQVATGSRVIRPSDDPSGASRILHLQAQGMSLGSYCENLDTVMLALEQSHGILQNVSDNLTRARQLLSQAASGTYSAQNRANIAQEIDSLLEHIVSMANTESLGRHLFSGARVVQEPYAVTRRGGQIVTVEYQGSRYDLPVPVAPGVEYSGVMVGDRLFRSRRPAEPLFLGNSGAQAGCGASNVTGDVTLSLVHTQTTFLGDSHGLANGAGAAAGNTILGQHVITIDIPGDQISLDGGPPQAFLGAGANMELTNDAGDKIYLDVTAVNPGDPFVGDIVIQGNGTLSIDAGASTTALTDFIDDRVAVTHSQTGQVLYVDATGIQHTGQELVRVIDESYDLFAALINIRDVMLSENGITEGQQSQLLEEAMFSMERVMNGLTQGMASAGGRLHAMDSLRVSLTELKDDASDQAALIRQADIVQVATDLARTQTLYEMTLATASRLLRMSLLDYIS